MVYTIDLEFASGEKRKLYFTTANGLLKNIKVVENRFEFYDVTFIPENKIIKSINYSFEDD